ncbi:MAG: Arm DNA-binding domain-containing protein [Gemmatimonadota bacterium]|nr:Arm DNA-binding domain-containing protein [Gemmatimonadota bacterium]
MERPKMLNASFVKSVRRPGRYGDGRGGYGLSLLVKPTSTGRTSKTWAQRLYINGRAVNLGLGAYPLVTLREARAKAFDNRRRVARGWTPGAAPWVDPSGYRGFPSRTNPLAAGKSHTKEKRADRR